MHMRLMMTTLLLATAMGTHAMAQDATTFVNKPHLSKEEWQKLSPEDKARMKAERQARWEKMTPEEREKFKAERKERWDKLPAEEKERIKAERKERWEKMTPEERARHKQFREEHLQPAAGNDTRVKLSPAEEKSNRAHLRRGEGISRPAGVDEVITNR
jgi:Skp family chaperone for outer membrane proteins